MFSFKGITHAKSLRWQGARRKGGEHRAAGGRAEPGETGRGLLLDWKVRIGPIPLSITRTASGLG